MSDSLSKPTLPTFSWIGHLKDDDRELLSSYGEFFPGHPGNIIIEEGVLQTEVFVVISGELEVHGKDANGTPILRARVGPGETLGEISLFDPGPATATVTASEFCQLWRIADSDLISFMEDNPGAGNVLLRTLASILAQRLRRVDPAAFGLSAYAVVDSPELEEQDPSRTEDPFEEIETTPSVEAPAAHLSPVIPLPSPDAAAPGQTSAPLTRRAPPYKKMATGTQVIPDPDELEPL
jgi:CRP/FNR family transcriptional regulator, cyclic AMP receptor protein